MLPKRNNYLNKRTLGFSKVSIIKSNKTDSDSFKYQLCYGLLYDEKFYDCTVCDYKIKCENLSKK